MRKTSLAVAAALSAALAAVAGVDLAALHGNAWGGHSNRMPTGKRNSWSVKQGQRRATKHRNQSRHRQALRG